MPNNKICLAMMMKNEAKNLHRSLSAIKPFIHEYRIIDTESTDGSIDVARKELEGIPGEFGVQEWVNWGHNRTEVIKFAQRSGCDWIFILDADEEVHDLEIPELSEDSFYWISNHYGSVVYERPNLIHAKYSWRYDGVTHEYLTCSEKPLRRSMKGYLLTDPARCNKSPEACAKDAELLEEALKSEPENERYQFYLAQSYKDSNQPEKAIEAYKKRADMGGWPEEVYLSLLRIAQLMEGRRTFPEVMVAYIKAHEFRPKRAGETMLSLSRYAAWWARGTPYPVGDYLFVDPSCYRINPK